MRIVSKRQHGFTLFEVLVALAIVSIALAAALKVSASTSANVSYLQEKTFANWVGMNAIAQYELAPEWPGTSKKLGTETLAKQEWAWQLETFSTDDPNVRRMEVSVRRSDAGEKDFLVTLTAFYRKP